MNDSPSSAARSGSGLLEQLRKYHFELKHVMVLFVIIVATQILISLVQKYALQDFLAETQDSYKRDSSERLANLTATSLELLLATASSWKHHSPDEMSKVVEAFNIILSQQLLLQGVEEICLLVSDGRQVYAIDNGQVLYDYFFGDHAELPPPDVPHDAAISMYASIKDELRDAEQIKSHLEDGRFFHVFVPFVPKGEYAGALYLKNQPDFNFITSEIVASYNESSLIFTGLILFGLIGMFYISSNTVRERDEAQELLFREREAQLEERIHYQKEAQFTKRIYHTHHKAEKVMGFIKEDLRLITGENIDDIKARVTRYANFISRVIYDMKWYEPPIQAIRNPIFRTDLNEVIRFIVDNICLRVARRSGQYTFRLALDEQLPSVAINEFVVWEILEPLFQNSMDHNSDRPVNITIETSYDAATNRSQIRIADDGKGLDTSLLQSDEHGTKRLFKENISTKADEQNAGYGCYLAYEISKQRCGWQLDAENLPGGGCRFTLTIPH